MRRLGATRNEPVDVVDHLSATNADLPRRHPRAAASARTSTTASRCSRSRLPPLRERGRGRDPARRALPRARVAPTTGCRPRRCRRRREARLLAHPWPGNVRELGNVHRAGRAPHGRRRSSPPISSSCPRPPRRAPPPAPGRPTPRPRLARRRHARASAAPTLVQTGWNISRTAALARDHAQHGARAHREVRSAPGPWRAATARRAPRIPTPSTGDPEPSPAGRPASPASPARGLHPIRWEPRRITLLRATLVAPERRAVEAGRALDVLVDKLQLLRRARSTS